ncbi:MAG: ComF family protein [Candidatus Omnitrophica bacterium]|nr:ComF family protein [Candidatus Omnitrophota bacterium]
MRLKKEMSRYIEAFIRLFYPAYCHVCGRQLNLDEWAVCGRCLTKVKHLKKPLCRRCGLELPPYARKGWLCNRCRGRKTAYDRLWVPFAYEGAVQTMLRAIKFRKKRGLIRVFRPLLEGSIVELRKERIDFIIPVPLDGKRKRIREFNQSALLAKEAGRLIEKPVREDILRKKRHTEPQSILSRQKRFANVRDAFGVLRPSLVKGKDILLVDDIITTGSTVNECARILKGCGAKNVHVLALARTN